MFTYIPFLSGTPKALKTSAHPGLTRALSTRLKLSLNPLIYAFDTPGVMVPFLGRGDRGAERGVKLALIGKSSGGIASGQWPVRDPKVTSHALPAFFFLHLHLHIAFCVFKCLFSLLL